MEIPGRKKDTGTTNLDMDWQFAEISKIITENYRTKTFHLIPQKPFSFQSGNHIDIRLTSESGYQAQRSYSISSHPGKNSSFEITVELIKDGEISPYFINEIIEGDKIEFRGPIGGPFNWISAMGGPLLLLAGGSGIAPLRSIINNNIYNNLEVPSTLAYSCRTKEDLIYSNELNHLSSYDHIKTHFFFTRENYQKNPSPRINESFLDETLKTNNPEIAYFCGSSQFVEAMCSIIIKLGFSFEKIKTERFGPSK